MTGSVLGELGVRLGTLLDFLEHFHKKEVNLCVERIVSGSDGADITIKSIQVSGLIKHVIDSPPGLILEDATKVWKHQYENTRRAAEKPPFERDLKIIKYDKIFVSLNSVVEITWD